MKQLIKVFKLPGKAERKESRPGHKVRLWMILGMLMVMVTGCSKENVRPRDLFGYWSCKETSDVNGSRGYNVFIDQYGSELDKIIIDNFYNKGYGTKVIAVLLNGKLTIEEQQVNGITYSGTGEIAGIRNNISFDYTAVADTLQDHIIAKYEHQ